jgi:uncharacterized membrane protein
MDNNATPSLASISSHLSIRARFFHHLAIVSYIGLLILIIASVINSNAPAEVSRTLMYSVKLIPLIIFIPGLLKMSARTHVWLCFVVLFYFTQSVVNVWLSKGYWFDVLTCITTISLFIASMMYAHWHREGANNLPN